ncbi:MAG: ATP-binding protein [Marinobacterium sp.]|nr:ATP-binding protein [Marinobacterium sp.]
MNTQHNDLLTTGSHPDNPDPLHNNRILLVDDTQNIHDDFRKVLCPVQQDNHLDLLEADLFGDDAPPTTRNNPADNQPVNSPQPDIRFELDSAYQGEQALEKVMAACQAQRPYAMVFVDVRMPPGWDGIETLEKLWQADPHLQAVICTAYSDYSWEDTFRRLGQSDQLLILKKPFDPVEVEQLASALTSKWNLARKARLSMRHLKQMVQQRTATVARQNQQLEQQKQQLEQQLQTLKDTRLQLIQAEKLAAIGQLSAGMAHEINNPIGFIRSNLGSLNGYINQLTPLLHPLLQPPADPTGQAALLQQLASNAEEQQLEYLLEDMQDVVSECSEGVDRISNIVADLHSFSHVSSEGLSAINLNRVLEQAQRILANQLTGIEIRQQLAPLPEFVADGARVSSSIVNLLQNAIDALQQTAHPCITLHTQQQNGQLELQITDNGCGIEETLLPRIFDPFYTSKDVGHGTGLGLHSVQQLVTELGGSIRAHSQPGTGTTMTIQLPAPTTGG